MPNENRTYYVICEDNCKFESMTKEQIIAAIAEATGETPVHIDDAFITKIKEQNHNGTLKWWVGTQAQYNAIATKDAATLYIITDFDELEDLRNRIYPVGSIYMSVESTSPASLYGGTWEQLKDRFLLSAGDTYTAGATGGEATHTLTIEEMPSHNHNKTVTGTIDTAGEACIAKTVSGNRNYMSIGAQGGGQAHNNMPPYLAVYMWKRTA